MSIRQLLQIGEHTKLSAALFHLVGKGNAYP